MYYAVFDESVKDSIIKHSYLDKEHECGGFLYGRVKQIGKDTFCHIDAVYYEDKVGTDCHFNFSLPYICRARQLGKQINFNLVGTYHSHGNYHAVLSDVDYNELQKFFGLNTITVVYSPKYSELVGEFLDKDGSHRVKILNKDNFSQQKKFNSYK